LGEKVQWVAKVWAGASDGAFSLASHLQKNQ